MRFIRYHAIHTNLLGWYRQLSFVFPVTSNSALQTTQNAKRGTSFFSPGPESSLFSESRETSVVFTRSCLSASLRASSFFAHINLIIWRSVNEDALLIATSRGVVFHPLAEAIYVICVVGFCFRKVLKREKHRKVENGRIHKSPYQAESILKGTWISPWRGMIGVSRGWQYISDRKMPWIGIYRNL